MRAADWLPSLPVVGIVTMMISGKNQRLGDFLVGSVVVHDNRLEEIRPDEIATAEETRSTPEVEKLSPEEMFRLGGRTSRLHSRYFYSHGFIQKTVVCGPPLRTILACVESGSYSIQHHLIGAYPAQSYGGARRPVDGSEICWHRVPGTEVEDNA